MTESNDHLKADNQSGNHRGDKRDDDDDDENPYDPQIHPTMIPTILHLGQLQRDCIKRSLLAQGARLIPQRRDTECNN